MGLISRVSSRTYRLKMFTTIARRNPAAIIAGVPAALSNTVGFVSGGFLKMSVKEFVLTSMVAAEIGVWFCLGEILGKRKIIGYDTRTYGEQIGTSFQFIPLPESITKSHFLC